MSECHRKKLGTTKIKRSGLPFIQVDRDTIINTIRQKERKEGIEKFVSGSDSQKKEKKKKKRIDATANDFSFRFVCFTHTQSGEKEVGRFTERASERASVKRILIE